MKKRRILELVGLAMIGEGLMATMRPQRYMELWDCGPKWLRTFVGSWARHPEPTRVVGILELVAGVALALRQTDAQPAALL